MDDERQYRVSFGEASWLLAKVLFLIVFSSWVVLFVAAMWPAWRMSLSELDLRGVYFEHVSPNLSVRDEKAKIQGAARLLITERYPLGSDAAELRQHLERRGFQCMSGQLEYVCHYEYSEFSWHFPLYPILTMEWLVQVRFVEPEKVSKVDVYLHEMWP
jgi:hypothetical protein